RPALVVRILPSLRFMISLLCIVVHLLRCRCRQPTLHTPCCARLTARPRMIVAEANVKNCFIPYCGKGGVSFLYSLWFAAYQPLRGQRYCSVDQYTVRVRKH